jgi:hypothetical protein
LGGRVWEDRRIHFTTGSNRCYNYLTMSWKNTREGLGGALLIAAALLTPFLPYWHRWGTTDDEVNRTLPGDELVPHPRGGYTQAVSIRSSLQRVWPWLVQIGQRKGGFYSYELLENMVGCNIHNADRILAEYQDIKVGDKVVMHPKVPAIPVVAIELGRALVYGGRQDENTANVWIFFISQEEGLTRLISRWVFDYKPGLVNKVAYNWLLVPIAAVMQRKMLLGIKERVEGS